jgi:hypothetical protein
MMKRIANMATAALAFEVIARPNATIGTACLSRFESPVGP